MPHKHKRKRDDDKSYFDLDPAVQAKPLPAYKPLSIFTSEPSNKRRKGAQAKADSKAKDDTPKAFARMMAWQAAGKRPSGLDNGLPRNKTKTTKGQRSHDRLKTKGIVTVEGVASETSATDAPTVPNLQTPKILPGESLSAFALRVDQSLPLSAAVKSSTHNPIIPSDIKPKARITKHNKRLQKMIADWRTTDAKLKEKQEDEDDDREDQQEEQDLLWNSVKAASSNRKGKKKNKRTGPHDDDPWRDLEKRRRAETKQKSLQDVVQAPPTLVKVKNKFKTKTNDDLDNLGDDSRFNDDLGVDVKDVPNSVGSLKRREDVGRKRREVIEGYRKMQGRNLKGKGLGVSLPRTIMT